MALGTGAVTMKDSAMALRGSASALPVEQDYGRIRRDLAKNEEDDVVVGRADVVGGS